MTETDTIIIDTTARIFRELGDPRSAGGGDDGACKAALWTALEENGLSLAWVTDDLGGAGAGIGDGFDILRTAGGFAVAVPLAETLLAGWLLAEAGIAAPAGPMTIALAGSDTSVVMDAAGTLTGRAQAVPFAPESHHIALIAETADGPRTALVETSTCRLDTTVGIAGDSLADVTFDGATRIVAAELPGGQSAGDLMLMGAAVRASQMAGALEAVLEIAVDYAGERAAFGRPIGKFQAIQHNLARLAGETAAALAAAGSAADTIARADVFDEAAFLEIAAAKIRTGEAAGEGAAIAHQVHGAIGFTEEHVLHRFTRRLWTWRDDFGSESEWAAGLGAMVAQNGADMLWPMLAAR